MKEWDFKETSSKFRKVFGFTLENLKKADAKRIPVEEIDFTEQIINREMANLAKSMKVDKSEADEKAGYPPKCNAGYEVSEDGKKCVPIKKDEAGWKKKKTK